MGSRRILVYVCVAGILISCLSALYFFAHSADAACSSAAGPKRCWSAHVESDLASDDVPGALKLLVSFSASEPRYSGVCHSLAHEIGNRAYFDFAAGHPSAYSPDMEACSFGFFHGFMEALMTETRDMAQASSYCTKTPNIPRDECFHGIGHGMVDQHDPEEWNNVPEILTRSLSLCRAVGKTERDYLKCAGGVYNGIANAYWQGEYGLRVDAAHPFAVCQAVPEGDEDRGTCISYMSRALLAIPPRTLKSALTAARDTAGSYAERAVEGVAIIYAQRKGTEQEALGACETLSSGLRAACEDSYALGLVQREATAHGQRQALSFCPLLPEQEQETCFEKVLEELSKRSDAVPAAQACAEMASGQAFCEAALKEIPR